MVRIIANSMKRGFFMKKLLSAALTLLCAVLFLAVMPTDADSDIYEDTVRLHILANSNSKEDQYLKLSLRDAVLEKYGKEIKNLESQSAAKQRLSALLPEIESFSSDFLKKNGSVREASVTLSKEWYDTRVYGDFSLPAGYYDSLKIEIGEAEGENWWCVMFPPLCLETALSDTPYTKEERNLIAGRYNVKFKLLELISEIDR